MNRPARSPAVLALLLGGLSLTFGQSPTPAPSLPAAAITAPATASSDAPLAIFGDRPAGAARLRWDLLPPGVPYEVWDGPKAPGGMLLIRRPAAGVTYRVGLTVLDGTGQVVGSADREILVGSPPIPGPTPTPQPPTPVPQPTPAPVPAVNPVPDTFPFAGYNVADQGRQYGAELATTFADSLDKAATAILSGAPMDGARADHATRWAAARNAAFDRRFQGMLDTFIPPGTANPTIEQRRRYAQFLNGVAAGARGVK